MISIEVRYNGDGLEKAVFDAAVCKLESNARRQLERLPISERNQVSVSIRGTSLDNLSVHVSGPQEIAKKITGKFQ